MRTDGDVMQPGMRPTEQLASELRELREASRKSLRELERETHASDSSLSRYLSGQLVPPWPVVESLCVAGGRDPATLRVLWEAAEQVRAGRRQPAAPYPAPLETGRDVVDESRPAAHRWRRRAGIFAAGVVIGLGAAFWISRVEIVNEWLSYAPRDTPDAPYFQVDLLRTDLQGRLTLSGSRTAPCANGDEFRRTYDLPAAMNNNATGYLVVHSDCLIKLFQGSGGVGYGEELMNDGHPHVLSHYTYNRGSSLVSYGPDN